MFFNLLFVECLRECMICLKFMDWVWCDFLFIVCGGGGGFDMLELGLEIFIVLCWVLRLEWLVDEFCVFMFVVFFVVNICCYLEVKLNFFWRVLYFCVLKFLW